MRLSICLTLAAITCLPEAATAQLSHGENQAALAVSATVVRPTKIESPELTRDGDFTIKITETQNVNVAAEGGTLTEENDGETETTTIVADETADTVWVSIAY